MLALILYLVVLYCVAWVLSYYFIKWVNNKIISLVVIAIIFGTDAYFIYEHVPITYSPDVDFFGTEILVTFFRFLLVASGINYSSLYLINKKTEKP